MKANGKVGTVYAVVKADITPFTKGMKEAVTMVGGKVEKIRGHLGKIGSAMTSLKGLAIGAFAGWGIQRVATSFMDAATTTENYRVRLKVLLGSQAEGNRLFDEMATYASKVPFELEGIMGSATALAGVMKGGVDEINQWMPMIGDLAAASGLTIQETTEQVSRMYSAGAASADLFRERGVLSMLGFQAGVSYSAEETRKQLIKAWTSADSQFAGATASMSNTWTGMMSMLADTWFQFRSAVMEAGVFDFIKDGAKKALEMLGNLKKNGQLGKWAKQMAGTVSTALVWIVKGIALVGDGFTGWQMIWEVLKIAWGNFKQIMVSGIVFIGEKIAWFRGLLGRDNSGLNADLASLRNRQKEWNLEILDSQIKLQDLIEQQSYLSIANDLIEELTSSTKGNANAVKDEAIPAVAEWQGATSDAVDEIKEDQDDTLENFKENMKGMKVESGDFGAGFQADWDGNVTYFDGAMDSMTSSFIASQNAMRAAEFKPSSSVGKYTGLPVGASTSFSVYKGETYSGVDAIRAWNPGVTFHHGGVVEAFHGGGFVQPQERLIKVQTGEGVVSRQGMASLGAGGLNAINNGGGGSVTIHANVITTDDVVGWTAATMKKVNDQRVGSTYATEDIQTAGLS